MKKMTFKFFIFTLLFSFASQNMIAQNSGFYQGQYDDSAWDNMLNSVQEKKTVLENKIETAEQRNLEVSYSKGSLTTVENFVIYASRDRENAAELSVYYAQFGSFETAFARQIDALGFAPVGFADYSPFQQLFLCLNVLDNAIAEIDGQLNGSIVLPKVTDFTTGSPPVLPENSSYYLKNGKPIFPTTLWGMPNDKDLMETVGYFGEVFLSPRSTDAPSGVVSSSYAKGRNKQLARHTSQNQTPNQIHITHKPLPYWMTQQNPEIDDFRRGFVGYDINNPKTYQFNREMLSSFATEIDKNNDAGPIIYVISNEPFFFIGEGDYEANNGVSQATIDAYIDYLESEYEGNIATLNSVYNPFNGNMNFSNFNAVADTYTIPVATSLRGTPAWYDWMRFHMNSVTGWHQNLKESVRAGDADGQTSIKIRGRDFEGNLRSHGIDMEQLMDIQDIVGFDNHTSPRETHFRNTRPQQDWLDNYSMEWREQSLVLDFAKSLHPQKPTFDSEWHGIATSGWVNYSIDRNYTRAAMWLAYTNGLSVMSAWWWYRENKDKPARNIKKGDISAKANSVNNTSLSPLHQPVAFDTFGRAAKEMNALSETVVTLAPEKRDYLIYYTEEAAIQDSEYMPQLTLIYEALKLLNYKVGFTTPNKIATQNHNPKAIIIPPTRYSTDNSYNELQRFKNSNSGVQVIAIEDTAGGKSKNYAFNEKGVTTNKNLDFVNTALSYENDINELVNILESNLPKTSLPIALEIKDAANAKAYGVLTNFGSSPSGSTAFTLINISKDNRTVLLPDNTAYTNMFTGEILNQQLVMKPNDVFLIKASDSSEESEETGGATLFAHCNFKGKKVFAETGDYPKIKDLNFPNRALSSVEVESGVEIELFSGENFQGEKFVLRATDNCLVDDDFDNMTKSFKVRSTAGGKLVTENQLASVNIFPNPNTEGQLYIDLSDLMDLNVDYKIIDIYGKVQQAGVLDKNHSPIVRIDLDNFTTGKYFVSLKPENRQVITQSIVIMTKK